MEKKKHKMVQWHPGFCSAVRLEFWENCEDLEYTNEYNLNRKPIQIDLVVIKKNENVQLSNEIGKMFRGHNIMEYKSPEDGLNIDVYFKGLAYACLYKAAGAYVDEISSDEITVTFVRDRKPAKLFKQLSEKNRKIERIANGIYYINEPWFPVQIIVTSQLNKEEHLWLRALTQHLSDSDAEQLVYKIHGLKRKDEKEFADSVLQVAMSANKAAFEEIKEGMDVCEALYELMKPEIDEAMEQAEKKGMEQGIEQGKVLGIEQGQAQGVVLGRAELIGNMLRNKKSPREIAEFCNCELKEIKEVQRKLCIEM